jgi:hypothetical protein
MIRLFTVASNAQDHIKTIELAREVGENIFVHFQICLVTFCRYFAAQACQSRIPYSAICLDSMRNISHIFNETLTPVSIKELERWGDSQIQLTVDEVLHCRSTMGISIPDKKLFIFGKSMIFYYLFVCVCVCVCVAKIEVTTHHIGMSSLQAILLPCPLRQQFTTLPFAFMAFHFRI